MGPHRQKQYRTINTAMRTLANIPITRSSGSEFLILLRLNAISYSIVSMHGIKVIINRTPKRIFISNVLGPRCERLLSGNDSSEIHSPKDMNEDICNWHNLDCVTLSVPCEQTKQTKSNEYCYLRAAPSDHARRHDNVDYHHWNMRLKDPDDE